ncbi:dTDP-4-dehydrorhamnose 3,5-epimerase [uncultured Megamonas sp.]|uniref:dTDP-4-dehydrorhamnose 3,5-epimerase n=1 Tax=uncultured Megamonas sp. TaxID=286140 RepID=UPI00259A94A5|nr:dTDP-4-dehydrorhamnose 3,5-epimerase [uncultured Megamonas sp.]
MNIEELAIKGVYILSPDVHEDYRGYYMESYSARTLHELGIDTVFVQDNHLLSAKKGTIRGIHFQNAPKSQAKLLRCTKGAIISYAVDLRKNSPTYLQYVSAELNEENKKQIYIPKGFGHLCISTMDNTEVQYKVDEFWEPSYERAITYADKTINLKLPDLQIIVSEKDKNADTLDTCDINFIYGENC